MRAGIVKELDVSAVWDARTSLLQQVSSKHDPLPLPLTSALQTPACLAHRGILNS